VYGYQIPPSDKYPPPPPNLRIHIHRHLISLKAEDSPVYL
jgi:hypothetical protein